MPELLPGDHFLKAGLNRNRISKEIEIEIEMDRTRAERKLHVCIQVTITEATHAER